MNQQNERPIPTRTGFVRLKFPFLQDWSGTVHVTGNVDDPAESLVVNVVSDGAFRGVPLDVRVEESADGVNWVERGVPARIELLQGGRGIAPAKGRGHRRAKRGRRSRD